MNQSVTFLGSMMLDIYRPELKARYGEKYKGEYSAEWTKQRLDFFHSWTLKSLRNQTFKDFTILMFCREESREIIESYMWDENIRHCYDRGKQALSEIDTEFVSITRMDTDDLFRFDLMEKVAENFSETKRYKRLLFSDYYSWLFHHGVFIHRLDPLREDRLKKWSPSYTLIAPTGIDVDKKWFLWPPDMCKRPYRVIGSDMVLDIKAEGSTHYSIWDKQAREDRTCRIHVLRSKRDGHEIIGDREIQLKILEDFL